MSNMDPIGKAAVLWTGGKDCALALYEAQRAGYEVEKLVTFAPPQAEFKAHALELIRMQAEAMGVSHELIPVREPYKESYQQAFQRMQTEEQIETIVTGDICEVAGYPNWVRECVEPLELEVYTPLWEVPREELLIQYIDAGLKIIISCVTVPWLSEEWLGIEMDHVVISKLQSLRQANDFDLCGEQGEYHTILLNAPYFSKEIHLGSYEKCQEENIKYIQVDEIYFQDYK